jgi:acyl-CoA dehydrogenase
VWAKLTSFGRGPSDALGSKVARALQQPGPARDRLTPTIWVDQDPQSGLGRLEHALRACTDAEPVLKKLKDAVRHGRLPKARPQQLLDQAVEQGILAEAERQIVHAAETARQEAVAVDSFTLAEYLATAVQTAPTATSPTAAR